jgi:CheY-like chemotaxis protein
LARAETPAIRQLEWIALLQRDAEVADRQRAAVDASDEDLKNGLATADSGRAAIEALQRTRPDVLVSDLGMPDQDGSDLIRQLRDDGHDARDLPAVALTAFVQKDDAHLALSAGFQIHLPKPVDPHELTSIVARPTGSGLDTGSAQAQ